MMLTREISQQYVSRQWSVSFFKYGPDSAGNAMFFDLSRNTGDFFEMGKQGHVVNNKEFNTFAKSIDGFLHAADDCLTTGAAWDWEGTIPARDGSIKWIKASAEIENFDGRMVLNGVFFDITEYKEIKAEYKKNKELLSQTGKLAKIGTWEIDLVANKLYWSEEVYQMHELDSIERVDLKTALSFYPEASRPIMVAAVDKLITDGIPYDIELPLLTAKGNRLYIRSSGNVVIENGKAVRIYGIIQNITASKQQEESQRVIFEFSTDAHLLIDDDGIIDCNNAALRMLKCDDKTKVVGRNPSEFSPEYQPDGRLSAEKAAEINQRVFEKGHQQFEWMHTRVDGTDIMVEVTINPVTIDNKPVLLVVWHDITTQKQALERLKSNEALLRDTQQLTHSGSWEIDMLTGKNYWSAEAFRIFGLEPKGNGPTTDEFDKMIHPDDREKYLDSIRMALKGGTSSNYDLRIIKPDGEVRHIQAIGKPFYNDNGQVIKLHGAIIDITDHKRAEENIRAKQEQLISFIEFSPAAIAIFDKDMRYIAASNIWKRDYKLERKNIIGVSHYDIFPESSLRWKEFHQRGFAGEVVSNPEDSYVRKNGRIQWFRWEIRPWYEKDDEIGGIIMFTEIITERKEAEQALVKAKEQAENAAQAKTQFLSTMSHEIRTPMNAVIGFTHLLLQNPREDQLEYLNILKFSGENLLVLINDILDFSKIEAGKLEFEDVDFSVKDLIRNTRSALIQRANEKGIQVKLMVDEDLPDAVIGDPVRLGQILTNLITNAIKFTNEGKVLIAASLVSQDDEYTTICFEVKDTGIGIPLDKQESIFESFTQASSDTTRKYGGTGLGLTITKRLLEMQGSQIKLDSEPGKGSTFYFDLKLKRSSLKIESEPGSSKPVVAKSLKGVRILLAEDNQINVLLAKQFLKQWDVECDVAENGVIAVQLAKTNNYDMILMDIQMPQMDGYTATEEIRKMEPASKYQKLPIIALTASAMLDNKDRAFVVGMNDYVSKPFNPDDLYRKISHYLQVSASQSDS
ncbi:PAS domain S-box protein [Mucilaginibacter sp. HMF5004]|uniref:PAS domain-containing hybrid sensor histidine kinase/response regulator n=1 Tax=Mucilaginibacter rivuli TaxID=2857527 RepID=UPI001C5D94B2|nr:PAS domain S-box protein [Mucilaginibacter rivuli]MBW4890919.1 PAS domain S-box protein [Mucilaginibacter rivuli]